MLVVTTHIGRLALFPINCIIIVIFRLKYHFLLLFFWQFRGE